MSRMLVKVKQFDHHVPYRLCRSWWLQEVTELPPFVSLWRSWEQRLVAFLITVIVVVWLLPLLSMVYILLVGGGGGGTQERKRKLLFKYKSVKCVYSQRRMHEKGYLHAYWKIQNDRSCPSNRNSWVVFLFLHTSDRHVSDVKALTYVICAYAQKSCTYSI